MKAPQATLAQIACVLVAAAATVDGRSLNQVRSGERLPSSLWLLRRPSQAACWAEPAACSASACSRRATPMHVQLTLEVGVTGPTLTTIVNIDFTPVPCLAFSPLVQDWTTPNSPTLYTATGNTRPPFNETEVRASMQCCMVHALGPAATLSRSEQPRSVALAQLLLFTLATPVAAVGTGPLCRASCSASRGPCRISLAASVKILWRPEQT
jgi:hypothetical protein